MIRRILIEPEINISSSQIVKEKFKDTVLGHQSKIQRDVNKMKDETDEKKKISKEEEIVSKQNTITIKNRRKSRVKN
jgi:hypothetical protein